MGLLEDRRKQTQERVEALRDKLSDANRLCVDKACVYMTGSFARGEATPHSDLDLFIVGKSTEISGEEQRLLRRLEEIRIEADLIEALAALGIPEFSGDGEYLEHYTAKHLERSLGTREDDAENTFTARLLLLLESKPLLGEEIYKEITDSIIGAYWKEYVEHKNDFMPAFLANDILRLWRTFCVNYEARTKREPETAKAKRKIKNYKLRHSRLMTCYSALLFLLAIYVEKNSVAPTDAATMVKLSPTERIESLLENSRFSHVHDDVRQLLSAYEEFLKKTEPREEELLEILLDKQRGAGYLADQHELGDVMSRLLVRMGSENRFFRMLIV
jgi:predicted nucleotidyltransferase